MISRSENFENGARHQELTDQWHAQEALNNYHEAVRQVGPNDRLYRFHANEANRHAREAGLGSGYGKVNSRIAYLQSACDIQENILDAQPESGSLLKNGKQHIQPPGIKAGGAALRCAVDGAAYK